MSQHEQRVQQLQQTFRAFIEQRDYAGLFDSMYTHAQKKGLPLPWVNKIPNPLLTGWAERQNLAGEGRRALVVGSGPGDDAEYLAHLGFQVAAFDFSSVAIEWAHQRFPDSKVEYLVADVLALPEVWNGQFDLVVEIFTIQSLPRDQLSRAIASVARTVAPGGTLFVLCLGADVVEPGPIPLPVTRADLDQFQQLGLQECSFEDFIDERLSWRLFRVEYREKGH